MAKTAKCERTGETVDLADGYFVGHFHTGEWQFNSRDAPSEMHDYNVAVMQILGSPREFCDWMAHLYQKSWFDPNKFFQFFVRFKEADRFQ
jgi:hypothetical protein